MCSFISIVFRQISYVPWPTLVLPSKTFQSHNIAFLLCPLLDNLHPNHHHHRKLDLYQVHWLTFLTFLCLFHHFSPYIFFHNFHALSFHFFLKGLQRLIFLLLFRKIECRLCQLHRNFSHFRL